MKVTKKVVDLTPGGHCFYCKRPIGQEHSNTCVLVTHPFCKELKQKIDEHTCIGDSCWCQPATGLIWIYMIRVSVLKTLEKKDEKIVAD